MKNSEFDSFLHFADRPDSVLGLAIGALHIAQSEYPELDLEAYLHQLDEMADAVRERVQQTMFPERHIAELNRYLFEEKGFKGNVDNYYALDNNFLNAVLDKKTGIPITLSVAYIEVGKRAGLPLVGINFPSHFIVKYKYENLDIFVDAYDNGNFMSEDALRAKLQENFREPVELHPRMLAEATNKEILARILRNLARAYTVLERYDKAAEAAQRITWLLPNAALDYRQLGYLCYKNDAYNQAITAFETYLQLEADARDAAVIERNIQVLRKLLASLN